MTPLPSSVTPEEVTLTEVPTGTFSANVYSPALVIVTVDPDQEYLSVTHHLVTPSGQINTALQTIGMHNNATNKITNCIFIVKSPSKAACISDVQ